MLPNKIDSKLYRHRNINTGNTNYQKRNIDIFRVYRNISFPTRYISHEKHKYAPICIPRDVQLAMRIFINRRSLLSLLRQRGRKETLAGLEYLWTWALIFSLSPSLSCILFFALLLLLAHTCTRILCMLHIFFRVFSLAHEGYMLHIFPYVFPIPFDTFFSPHGYCVLHMFPLTYSLSLFASLSPSLTICSSFSFRFLFLVGLFFMRVDTSCTYLFFSRIAAVFPTTTSHRAFPLLNSRQFVVCRRSCYSRLSHSHVIRDHERDQPRQLGN